MSDTERLLGGPKPRRGQGSGGTSVTTMLIMGALGTVAVAFFIAFVVVIPKTQNCGSQVISVDDTCVDWAIAGAGTAGLAAARHLAQSEGSPSVLVVESGADLYNVDDRIRKTKTVLDVLGYPYQYPGELHWQYRMPEDPNTGNQENLVSQGRTVGGSSSINNGVVVKGTKEYWTQSVSAYVNNAAAWTGDNVYDRMKAFENFTNFGLWTPDASHGDGTLPTQTWKATIRPTQPSADNTYVANLFGTALGIPVVDDYNAADANLCAFKYLALQQNPDTADFDRTSSQTAFLFESTYPNNNLELRVNSTVESLIFDDGATPPRAVGFRYYDTAQQKVRNVYTRKGVFMNMQLNNAPMLQRAGIGPAALLAAKGIKPRLVNENVGRNWKVHTAVWFLTFLSPNVTGTTTETPNTGFPTNGAGEGFFVDDDSVAGTPNRRSYEAIALNFPGAFVIEIFHLRPKASGVINIVNQNPQFPAIYDGRVFSEADDLLSTRTLLRRIITNVEAADPNVICVSIDPITLASDSLLDEWIKTTMNRGQYHNGATTRMGTSVANSVVGGDCRVHGIDGLFVGDLSILPELPDGNTATPAVLVGDTCARFALGELDLTPAVRRNPVSVHRSSPKHYTGRGKRTRVARMTDEEMHATLTQFMDTVHNTLPKEMASDIVKPIINNNVIWSQLTGTTTTGIPTAPPIPVNPSARRV